ncbi:MAG: hypothetical protein PHU62_01855 [Bacteroidales bacterium]|jgi:hypothetical protein|nr:hypothetical protein [Bacteroidales bacterium]MDD2203782.1 hypothetical protein [Bacteroidales bacterium]MDD3151978.1 hypothetical protein [Bacteroidales bacterium]MDD3913279.1 hypothetical protein [Bacteroidales bacterium]MDD4633310.1 hypothetical protein [Bacteroidales bacterium]
MDENLIYLLLAIGWVVISAVIGSKKKKQVATAASAPKQTTINDSGTFTTKETFFDKKAALQAKEREKFVKKTPKKEDFLAKKMAQKENFEKNFYDIEKKCDVYDADNQDVTSAEKFNLRQAIIFSEILNPPYINNRKN